MSLAERPWNGLEPNLALGRAIIYRTVDFIALQQAHLTSMADSGSEGEC